MHYRRTFGIMFATIFALCALAMLAAAQQQTAPFVVHRLKDNVYWIEGGVGNSEFVVGQNGVIVIDTKQTVNSGMEILADIAKVTPNPITHVILTHSDGDHVNGLVAFPVEVTIIAQDNCKKELQAAITAGARGALPREYLPNQTFDLKDSLALDGVRFQLLHYGPAHTSGDTIVYLPDQKIVFTGDILASVSPDPIIHMEKNGSPAGWIKTMKEIVKLDSDTYVPGHGDVQTKADVQKKLEEFQEKDIKIKALVAQGKTLEEVKEAMGVVTPPPAPPGGGGPPRFASFAETDYQELTKK
jgi:cyclase